ncbi:hypothetical protein MJT46_017012, partial [Ovis ammon polii x Ovis aries]
SELLVNFSPGPPPGSGASGSIFRKMFKVGRFRLSGFICLSPISSADSHHYSRKAFAMPHAGLIGSHTSSPIFHQPENGNFGPHYGDERAEVEGGWVISRVIAERKLTGRTGSVDAACGLSSRGTRSQLPHNMWNLPRPEIKPSFPALAGGKKSHLVATGLQSREEGAGLHIMRYAFDCAFDSCLYWWSTMGCKEWLPAHDGGMFDPLTGRADFSAETSTCLLLLKFWGMMKPGVPPNPESL